MRSGGWFERAGRLFIGIILLTLSVWLGFATSVRHYPLFTLALASWAGALYFLWTARHSQALLLRIGSGAAVVLAGVTCLGLFLLLWDWTPPREQVLAAQFRNNRLAFESLRRLLVEEAGSIDVAEWGIRTPQSPIAKVPPAGDFPRARFDEYLALLSRAGGKIAFREAGSCPDTCVVVWGSGFAADTRHVAVCSLCVAPENQVDDLDAWWSVGTGDGKRRFVYRHLDAEWYLRADGR